MDYKNIFNFHGAQMGVMHNLISEHMDKRIKEQEEAWGYYCSKCGDLIRGDENSICGKCA